LTAYYEVSLDEEMLFGAIDHKQFEWLSYVWAFGKNYIGIRRRNGVLITYELFFTGIKAMRKGGRLGSSKFLTDTLSTICKWF